MTDATNNLHIPPPTAITIEYADGQSVKHSFAAAVEIIRNDGGNPSEFMDDLSALSAYYANPTMTSDEFDAATADLIRDAYGDGGNAKGGAA